MRRNLSKFFRSWRFRKRVCLSTLGSLLTSFNHWAIFTEPKIASHEPIEVSTWWTNPPTVLYLSTLLSVVEGRSSSSTLPQSSWKRLYHSSTLVLLITDSIKATFNVSKTLVHFVTKLNSNFVIYILNKWQIVDCTKTCVTVSTDNYNYVYQCTDRIKKKSTNTVKK